MTNLYLEKIAELLNKEAGIPINEATTEKIGKASLGKFKKIINKPGYSDTQKRYLIYNTREALKSEMKSGSEYRGDPYAKYLGKNLHKLDPNTRKKLKEFGWS